MEKKTFTQETHEYWATHQKELRNMENTEKNGFEGIITESVIRKPEYIVKATEKKGMVARFINRTLQNNKMDPKSIEDYMGKPLNWWNYETMKKIVEEWEEKEQLKLELNMKRENVNEAVKAGGERKEK